MNPKLAHPLAWKLLLGGLVAAWLAAAWAWFGDGDCASCQAATALVHGKNLALLGMVYYGTLVVAAILLGPHPVVYGGTLLAASVHVGLAVLLLQAHVFCPPCVLAAISAILALGLAIRCEPANAYRASFVLPGIALLVETGVLLGGPPAALTELGTTPVAVQEEKPQVLVPPGRVHLVIYGRPDCGYCMELEQEVMPLLEREFGSHLEVERRSADGLAGVPTPTLILTGQGDRQVFPGLPSTEKLRSRIKELMGEGHGHETVLKESR